MNDTPPWQDEETLREMYRYDEGDMTLAEIADEFGVDPSTVKKWKLRLEVEKGYPWRDPDILHDLYVEERLSTPEIAEELGTDGKTVRRWLKRNDFLVNSPGMKNRSIPRTEEELREEREPILAD